MKAFAKLTFALLFIGLLSTTVYGQQPPPLPPDDDEEEVTLTFTIEESYTHSTSDTSVETLRITDRNILGIKE